ncbi:ABC transporter family substrate-binding protein [Corynebacterium sp.]|uniref:ABC transporter family substrate-binding protein n=1 Tax=Corynebacterium sp. TaxID=1720 RepID=UPI0026DCB93D|nr:ABC transporter family substrate-binding protein [Corynebacterium sp.]MDO4611035.1 ABC transporter family substrate-binding protein [Corynebacterium sp.]
MKTTMRGKLAAVIAAAGLVLTGCGGDGGDAGAGIDHSQVADYNPMERDQIKDGGELNLALRELSEQQNTFHADGTRYTKDVWRLYNPVLATFTPEGEYAPNPAYITDVKDDSNDDRTVVTFTINDKATYNDGTPIDWRAFENTWKFNNGTNGDVVPNSTDGYELIESVTAGDNDKQAVVTFSQPWPWWKGLFNELVPPQVKDAKTFNEAYLKKLHPEWGAGPFTVENVDFQKGEVSFVRNDKWWGEPAKLDRVSLRYMEDQASLNAFRNGEIDATGVGTADRLATARQMGDAIEIRNGREASTNLYVLNADAPLLGDAKVREAIMRGIDRKQLADIRFQGLDYEENAPGSFTLFESQEGYEDNFGEVVQFDPEKAASLLDEAGWTAGQDGIREKDGEKLTVRYPLLGDDPTQKGLTQALQAMMKGIGVDLQIEERPSSDFSRIMMEKDFDLIGMGFSSSDPYGVAYFGQIYGSDSELNKSGTGTPEFDKKIEELQKLPTAEEQIARANELEKEAFHLYGIMPSMTRPQISAVKPGLANYGPMMFGVIPWENVGWAK